MAVDGGGSGSGSGTVIELEEEIEGDPFGTKNYRFYKVGEPVPVRDNLEFDPQCLPSQPLAVSEKHCVLFVVHPEGFCVSKTKDVIKSAKDIKQTGEGSSVMELSLVDVQIGKVSMLSISDDEMFLAVVVGSDVHFFSIMGLLRKEKRTSYSVSIDDSSSIKDMRWAKKDPKAYVILSVDGKLYYGSGQGPPSCVMENVCSVDWSTKGNFLIVAKKDSISILSLQFKEKMRLLLPFESAGGGSDGNQVIKVDSVHWIRADRIAVGCFQLDKSGEEENYTVHVITGRGQRITDTSVATKPVLLSFSSFFMELRFDAVRARNGPHLFLKYLDKLGVAFLANRNLSKNVGLLCWPQNNEAAVVEILDDAWNLYLNEYQDNEEENVLLGLCVDKVSQNEDEKLVLGDEEREVSPGCVILCLTIDGKISVFHFFSAVGAHVPQEGALLDEEDDFSTPLMKPELFQISPGSSSENRETLLKSASHKSSRTEIEKLDAKAILPNDLPPFIHVNVRSADQNSHGKAGQKPVQISQKLGIDEPKKSFSIIEAQGSNIGKQSISSSEIGRGCFSGKVIGDFPSQAMGIHPLTSHSVEPFVKLPSRDSPSHLSDASKTPGGPLFSLPSAPVGSTENAKRLPKSTGGASRDPADIKDKAKSSPAFTSVGVMPYTAQGNNHSLTKEAVPASSPRRLLHSSPDALKQFGSVQFGNVEEMAKSLDNLLEGIEGEGGFVDACLTSQADSILSLEEGISDLSKRYRTQKEMLEDQLKQVQNLHDKAAQVLVRKVYMEGIFKQATDSRYWELWNRQKLSSELELKRKCILDVNQELTNQLIELERHFNSVEFNKFGDSGGIERNRRALQNARGHSGNLQSLHSLHNTMTAQLAAAEHLSGCLSEQMSVLSIESSGKHDVNKKLFESIGLPYVGDFDRSLGRDSTYGTPIKELLITSRASATKEQPRRNCVSDTKSYEPETARRQRDSLDRTWTTFEPPKTTIKRVLLKEDYGKGCATPSSLKDDGHDITPHLQKRSEVAHSALLSTFGVSLNRDKSKGTVEVAGKLSAESPTSSFFQGTAGSLGNAMQFTSKSSFSASPSPSIFGTQISYNSESGALKITDTKLKKNSLPFTGNSDSLAGNELKNVQLSDNNLRLTSSTSTEWTLSRSKVGFTNSATVEQSNAGILTENASFNSKIPFASASSFSSALDAPHSGSFAKSPEKPSQSPDGVSPSTSLPSVLSSSVPSSTVPVIAPSVPKPSSLTIFNDFPSDVAKENVSQPRPLFPSTPDFTSTFSLSSAQNSVSSTAPSSIVSVSESQISPSQPPVTSNDSKTECISQTQSLVVGTSSATKKDILVSQPQFGISTSISALRPSTVTENTEDLSKSSIEISPSTTIPSEANASGTGNDVISNACHEDDMDEADPEIDQSSGFSIGALGGFGIGSNANPNTAPRNPFGVAGANSATTSPFTMSPSPSGELFRSASFNLPSSQSPEPLKPTNAVSFGFGSNNPGQVPAPSGFGQPAQMGVGQQALGSVLGSFGQSRQVGVGLPGTNIPSASSFGGGFASGGFGGGFSSAAIGGGFAKVASTGVGFAGAASGGFASAATPGGGFGSVANAGGGFGGAINAGGAFGSAANVGGGFGSVANTGGGFGSVTNTGGGFGSVANTGGGFGSVANTGGGFGGAAASGGGGGGGFGGFSNQQQQSGGFGGFSNQQQGGASGAAAPPPNLFTAIRK